MEHVVQFGINIDDASIAEAVKRVYDSITRRKPFREACKKMDIIFDGIGGDSDD